MGRRIITTENLEEDVKIESHLRPQLLDDYIGQEKAKEQAITARLVEGPVAPVMPSTAQEVDDDPEMDDRTRRLIAGALSAFRSRG
mgnify:FL=1